MLEIFERLDRRIVMSVSKRHRKGGDGEWVLCKATKRACKYGDVPNSHIALNDEDSAKLDELETANLYGEDHEKDPDTMYKLSAKGKMNYAILEEEGIKELGFWEKKSLENSELKKELESQLTSSDPRVRKAAKTFRRINYKGHTQTFPNLVGKSVEVDGVPGKWTVIERATEGGLNEYREDISRTDRNRYYDMSLSEQREYDEKHAKWQEQNGEIVERYEEEMKARGREAPVHKEAFFQSSQRSGKTWVWVMAGDDDAREVGTFVRAQAGALEEAEDSGRYGRL